MKIIPGELGAAPVMVSVLSAPSTGTAFSASDGPGAGPSLHPDPDRGHLRRSHWDTIIVNEPPVPGAVALTAM